MGGSIMASTINSDTSNGLILTPDTTGEIELQSAGTTQAKITSSGLQNASGVAITAQSGKNLIINGDMVNFNMDSFWEIVLRVVGIGIYEHVADHLYGTGWARGRFVEQTVNQNQ